MFALISKIIKLSKFNNYLCWWLIVDNFDVIDKNFKCLIILSTPTKKQRAEGATLMTLHLECFFLNPMPPHVLMDFVVLPPGHGRTVTAFWGWDTQEAQLRCPNDVSGDLGGPLNLNSTNLPRPWSPRESSPSGKIPTVESNPGPHD